MRLIALMSLTLALTACGANGPPETPVSPVAKTEGITISGEVSVGLTTTN